MNDMRLWLDALLAFLVLTGAVFALIGSWSPKPTSDLPRANSRNDGYLSDHHDKGALLTIETC